MWKFAALDEGGANCELFGVNIFDYKWEYTYEDVVVPHPTYNQEHKFGIFKANINGKVVTFAAGEFSSNIFGFYLNE